MKFQRQTWMLVEIKIYSALSDTGHGKWVNESVNAKARCYNVSSQVNTLDPLLPSPALEMDVYGVYRPGSFIPWLPVDLANGRYQWGKERSRYLFLQLPLSQVTSGNDAVSLLACPLPTTSALTRFYSPSHFRPKHGNSSSLLLVQACCTIPRPPSPCPYLQLHFLNVLSVSCQDPSWHKAVVELSHHHPGTFGQSSSVDGPWFLYLKTGVVVVGSALLPKSPFRCWHLHFPAMQREPRASLSSPPLLALWTTVGKPELWVTTKHVPSSFVTWFAGVKTIQTLESDHGSNLGSVTFLLSDLELHDYTSQVLRLRMRVCDGHCLIAIFFFSLIIMLISIR